VASLQELEKLKAKVDSMVAKAKRELTARQKQLTLARFQNLKRIPAEHFEAHPLHAGFLSEFEKRVVIGGKKITVSDFAKMLAYHKHHFGSARPRRE